MYPVSAAFLTALKDSHTVIFKAEVYSKTNVFIQTLSVLGGNINVSLESAQRRRASVQVGGASLVPTTVASLLHPLSGNRVKLYRGIRFANGTEEYCPCGYFVVVDAETTRNKDGLRTDLSLIDLSQLISEYGFNAEYVVAVGTNYKTAMSALITSPLPSQPQAHADITAVTPQLVFDVGDDRLEKLQTMAADVAHQQYMDPNGTSVIKLLPRIDVDASVFTYVASGKVIVSQVTNALTRRDTKNHIIVRGESTSNTAPVQGSAWDSNSSSATYAGAPPGTGFSFYAPELLISEYITTTTQADSVAAAKLRQKLGVNQKVTVTGIVNPALEAGDIVTVDRPDAGISAQKFVVADFNIPMSVQGSQTLDMREGRAA